MGKKTKSNEPKRKCITSSKVDNGFESLINMFSTANTDYMNRFRLTVDDLLTERNMLLAAIVNKIPEKFQKVRYIIDSEEDKDDLLQTDVSFYIKLRTETGDIYFSVQNDMWFDFGCEEITIKENDMKPCAPVFRQLILKSLLDEYENEKKVSCEYHHHSENQEKDDIVYTASSVSSETFFDDDEDDELIPCKDEGIDSDLKDMLNHSNSYTVVQDDDDDDDDD